jgi:hypothetical protein
MLKQPYLPPKCLLRSCFMSQWAPQRTSGRIDHELAKFLESGVSVILGTRDTGLKPELVRGWGPRVREGGRRLDICLALGAAEATLGNLRANGKLAMTVAYPCSYRSLQIKGRCVAIAEPDQGDLVAVERHRDAFARQTEPVGVSQAFFVAFWQRELARSPVLVRISLEPEHIFDQTPGARAGKPL